MDLTKQQVKKFQGIVWQYYREQGRTALPWRQPESDGTFDPYKIMVSELMLQQTQVARVTPKYEAFLRQFPSVFALSRASLGDVLRAWQGLGYNRRAKYLWQSAQMLAAMATFPQTAKALIELPGIGANTAGAILAYSLNRPEIFIETNIRTVYIHHFLPNELRVPDKEISQLLERTVDTEKPREFYWALMDYGSYLKTNVGNVSRASKHFTKQSEFGGSKRQLRGQVIRLLSTRKMSRRAISMECNDERLPRVLQDLEGDGLINRIGNSYSLD